MPLKLDIYFWYFIGYKEVLCVKVAYVFFNEKIEIHFVLRGCNRTYITTCNFKKYKSFSVIQ